VSAPLPWGFGGSGAPSGEVWVWSAGGNPTADDPGGEDTRLFSAPPEVAERVVRAVNSHDDLLAALELAMGCLRESGAWSTDELRWIREARDAGLDAIDKARGGK